VAIRRDYFELVIRDFSVDTEVEMDKILTESEEADDLNLFVRISVSNRHSNYSLAGKFGTSGKQAARLLFRARQHADKLGICFHAGSQLMNPEAFRIAMHEASQLIIKSGVIIDILDVGGGFPSVYPALVPPPLENYLQVIADSFEESMVSETCELWCEPGRALVAEGASLVVKVELRKGNALYLNDGTYGGLFDAGQPAMVFGVRKISAFDNDAPMAEFSFYGPTCDSIDYMPGPFTLPEDIAEGDYIEVDNMGAYSVSMRTGFNHFNQVSQCVVDTVPSLSLYQGKAAETLLPRTVRAPRGNLQNRKPGVNVKAMIKETNHDAG
jgi:ornithine decarboxylase